MKTTFIALAVCALAVTLSGCSLIGIETCSMGTMRCKSNSVQICKMGLGWSDSMSCDDVANAEGGKWTCGTPKGVCSEAVACLPQKTDSTEKSDQQTKDQPDKDKTEKKEKADSREKADQPTKDKPSKDKTEKKEPSKSSR